MRLKSIKARRITIKREELTIDSDMLIQLDDPLADPERLHVPHVVRVDELQDDLKVAISTLFDLCDRRMARIKGIPVDDIPVTP